MIFFLFRFFFKTLQWRYNYFSKTLVAMCFELGQCWLWQVPYWGKSCFVLQTCAWEDLGFFPCFLTVFNMSLVRAQIGDCVCNTWSSNSPECPSCTSTMEYTCSTVVISSWHKSSVSQVYKSLGPRRSHLKSVEICRHIILL